VAAISGQPTRPRLPYIQKVRARSAGPLARCASRPMPAPEMALTARPTSSICAGWVVPSTRDRRDTTRVVSAAPPKLARGSSQRPAKARPSGAPSTMVATAARAAPLETPTRPGSARGLRNTPCMAAPLTARAAPTISRGAGAVARGVVRLARLVRVDVQVTWPVAVLVKMQMDPARTDPAEHVGTEQDQHQSVVESQISDRILVQQETQERITRYG